MILVRADLEKNTKSVTVKARSAVLKAVCLLLSLLQVCACGAARMPDGSSDTNHTETMLTGSVSIDEDADRMPEFVPKRFYGGRESIVWTDAEMALWQRVDEGLPEGCVHDETLSLAARKHASDVLQHASVVKENGIDYLRFALRLCGSADYLISPVVFDITEEGTSALRQVLEQSEGAWTHCGVGVQEQNGKQKAVFIAATRVLQLKSIPVQPKPGSDLTVSGVLEGNDTSDITAFLEMPNGNVRQLKSFVLGKKRFSITVPLRETGKYRLELQVTRGSGPETAVLLPLFVGVPVETIPSVFPVADERSEAPLDRMTAVINRIRRNLGLRELIRDVRLDEVAQSHCKDMVASEYFGHYSQSSGMLADRLKAKRLYPKLTAENIAQSSSLMRVHHNLMQSPSHKIKLLTPEFTHLGLGMVESGGMTVVTQVFAAW